MLEPVEIARGKIVEDVRSGVAEWIPHPLIVANVSRLWSRTERVGTARTGFGVVQARWR